MSSLLLSTLKSLKISKPIIPFSLHLDCPSEFWTLASNEVYWSLGFFVYFFKVLFGCFENIGKMRKFENLGIWISFFTLFGTWMKWVFGFSLPFGYYVMKLVRCCTCLIGENVFLYSKRISKVDILVLKKETVWGLCEDYTTPYKGGAFIV